jgi:hypothetical protein
MIKQGRSKFKGPIDVDLVYGKVPQIIVHGVEFISAQQFVEVYDLNNHGQCPQSLKVPKYLEKSKVEAFFGAPTTKNGYKYMKCDDFEFIAFIENL